MPVTHANPNRDPNLSTLCWYLESFLPARPYASAGTSYGPVSVSVCHKSGVLLNWLDESSWFLARRLPSTYPTMCYNEIQVSTEIRVLSWENLSNMDLENFATISRSSTCCQLSSRKVDAQSVINWTVVVGQLSWQYLRWSTPVYVTDRQPLYAARFSHAGSSATADSDAITVLKYSIFQATMSALYFVMRLKLCPSVNSWYIEMLLSWRTYRNSTISTWLLATWLVTVAKMNCMSYLTFCNSRL